LSITIGNQLKTVAAGADCGGLGFCSDRRVACKKQQLCVIDRGLPIKSRSVRELPEFSRHPIYLAWSGQEELDMMLRIT
jgi:hypothetical protein